MPMIRLYVSAVNGNEVVGNTDNCIVTDNDLDWIGARMEYWIRNLVQEHQSLGIADENTKYIIKWEFYSSRDLDNPERVYIVKCRSERLMVRLLAFCLVDTVK